METVCDCNMKTGIIARPRDLKFVGNTLTCTHYYYEHCKKLETDKDGIFSNVKTVLAANHDEAVAILKKRVGDALRSISWLNPKPEDFTFSVYFSEVTDGEFWHDPSSTFCKNYMPE